MPKKSNDSGLDDLKKDLTRVEKDLARERKEYKGPVGIPDLPDYPKEQKEKMYEIIQDDRKNTRIANQQKLKQEEKKRKIPEATNFPLTAKTTPAPLTPNIDPKTKPKPHKPS